jgi:CRISPR/Cas system CSM-associated protein Csm5 (group 7 of RAMP superfamily)
MDEFFFNTIPIAAINIRVSLGKGHNSKFKNKFQNSTKPKKNSQYQLFQNEDSTPSSNVFDGGVASPRKQEKPRAHQRQVSHGFQLQEHRVLRQTAV